MTRAVRGRRSLLRSSLILLVSLTAGPAFGISASAQTGQDDSTVLTLRESIAIALRNATLVLAAGDTLRATGTQLLQAHAQFLPSLTLGATTIRQQGTSYLSGTALTPASARFRTLGYQASTSLNLFNGFRDQAGVAAALKARGAAESTLEWAKQQVAFDVTQAYFQVVLDRHLVEIAKNNLELSRTRETQFAEGVRVGRRAPPDLYRQQAQTSADEAALLDAQARERNDVMQLLRRLRVDLMKSYKVAEAEIDTTRLDPASLNIDAAVDAALQSRPDLQAVRLQYDQARERRRQAAAGRLPQVNLGFDIVSLGRVFDYQDVNGESQITTGQRGLFPQMTGQGYGVVTLGLSWNLFDRRRTQYDIELADLAISKQRLAAEDLRLRVISDVRQALGDYTTAQQRLTATAAGVEAAQKAYEAMEGRFSVGLASFVDLIGAQVALAQAKALRAEALIRFSLQKRALLYLTARPIDAP
jgi:outer membrane protein